MLDTSQKGKSTGGKYVQMRYGPNSSKQIPITIIMPIIYANSSNKSSKAFLLLQKALEKER